MAQLLDIEDVKVGARVWSSVITVIEKHQPGQSLGSPTRYQKYVFVDAKGAIVEGIVYNADIEILANKLQLFKKYKISNAKVSNIRTEYQKRGLTIQWTLSSRTPILEIQGDVKMDTTGYKYVAFDDLTQFMDDKDNPVDILAVAIEAEPVKSLFRNGRRVPVRSIHLLQKDMKTIRLSLWDSFAQNEGQHIVDDLKNFPVVLCRRVYVSYFDGLTVKTSFDTHVFVNPEVKEASELKTWIHNNSGAIRDLVRNKGHQAGKVDLKIKAPLNITPLSNVDSSDMGTWVKVMFSFKSLPQKYWYMACSNCHSATEALYEDEFNCNACGADQKAHPRCHLDTDLIDDTDIVPAMLFGDVAEKALKMKPVDVMNSTTEALESHLASLQDEFDDKMLLVKIKAAKMMRPNSKQHYIISFYSDANSDSVEIEGTTINLHEKFDEVAAEDDSLVTRSSKRAAAEGTQASGDMKRDATSETTKKLRNKRN